jgi:hypothetical protein
MAPASKKTESKTTETRSEEVSQQPATPANSGVFESYIKDGPSQDDLNPAYAPPEDDSEAAQAGRKLADEESDDDKDEDGK